MKSSSNKSLQELHPKRIDIPILTVISIYLLAIGLTLPILTVKKLWHTNTYSIFSGIQNLWDETYYALAVIIFVFSIIFPIAKLVTLLAVWFLKLKDNHRQNLIESMEVLGKWSMLDVFVSAVLIIWVKLGSLATAKAEDGLYFFAGSVLLTMIISSLQGAIVKKH